MTPTTIGILGIGQLGQMLALAAIPLGIRCLRYDWVHHTVYESLNPDPRPVETCDLETFCSRVSAITCETEHVPAAVLAACGGLLPGTALILQAQNRIHEKEALTRLGIPIAPYILIHTPQDCIAPQIRFPAILKTADGGYDGLGQRTVHDPLALQAAFAALGGRPCVLEERIRYRRELSCLAVLGPQEIRTYPLIENVHIDGILRLSHAPIDDGGSDVALAYVHQIAAHTDYRGILTLELFETDKGLLVNEIAPRVHNSGHWTLEGSFCSQFENHMRAQVGLPLGDPGSRARHLVLWNLIGTVGDPTAFLAAPRTHLHLYGKSPRPGRKLGHVTGSAPDRAALSTLLDQWGQAGDPHGPMLQAARTRLSTPL